MKYISAIDVIGKCDQCGLENVEITVKKSNRNKESNFVINANQQMVHTDIR